MELFTVDEVVPGLANPFRLRTLDGDKAELQFLKYNGIRGSFGLTGNTSRGYIPVINLSSGIRTTALSFGANLAFDLPTSAFNSFKAGLGFNGASIVASLTLSGLFDNLKGSFSYVLNPLSKTAFAAEVNHSFSMNRTAVTIGAQHALFPLTLLKVSVNTSGRAGVLIQQQLWQSLSVSIAGEMALREVNKLPKIGFSFSLQPQLSP